MALESVSDDTNPAPGEQLIAAPKPIKAAGGWWFGIGVLWFVSVGVALVIAVLTDEPSNSGFVDGAAVLAFVTAIAVGVERTIEVIWGQVDRNKKKGTWWPLSLVTKTLNAVETEMNTALEPFVKEVDGLFDQIEDWSGDIEEKGAAVEAMAARIKERANAAAASVTKAQTDLAPGSARFALIARATDDFAHDAALIARKAGVWSDKFEIQLRAAGEVLTNAQDIVGAFKTNPARKTMSIALGVPLAILASGLLGLNMFAAVLGPDVPGYMAGFFGVLATGVVMGLGSSPTHEVIRALQRRKGDSTIDVPVASSVQVVEVEVPVAGEAPRGQADTERLAARVARLDSFESDTIMNLAAVRELMASPTAPRVVRTTYVSNRQVRPIRNPG